MCCPSTHATNLKLLVNFHKEIESMKVELKESKGKCKIIKHDDKFKRFFENGVDQKDILEMKIKNLERKIELAKFEYDDLIKEITETYQW